METKIIIFLAFTSVTLIFNALVIWYAYKAFAKASTVVTDTIRDMETSDSAKAWVNALEVAATNAVTVSEAVRAELVHVDPVIARAQAKYEFKLAEIDIQLEKAFAAVLQKTERAQRAVVEPANKIGAAVSGVREVIQFLGGELGGAQTADDASSTQKP
jgi:hypothetical protein